jgi:uncharacterized RDD family membrane protein YckC
MMAAAPMVAATPVTQQVPMGTSQTMVFSGVGRRFVAALLDGIVLGFLTAGISYLGGADAGWTTNEYDVIVRSGGMSVLMGNLISLIIYGAYYIYFIGSMGQTPGKRIMSIKVVTTSGEHPSFGTAAMRYLVSLLSAAVFLLGYLWAFFNKERQTWHDKAAGTYVVKA